ncbi:ribonuclease toxin immunity protein CdiI [Thermoactinomyces mirandus]|uniref:CDI immunity protein domain-containing protein n=1 Tax=Thermoactinomyces mirandus TaxID=2756294 RepID=A0A7W1XT87_9BACL|nr:ribonuclease toxin immunity protein CdiI [Thermoactinomyces mirandus]MBA4602741.1 hypothetical protein [Thermoactinomyces mirandus]
MNNPEEEDFKIMETIEEKEKVIDIYFTMIVGDYYFIKCLNEFKDQSGFGIESFGILFYQDFEIWDEFRCKENEVALLDYPAAEKDRIGYLDFQQFYPYVYQYGQRFIQKHPERKEEVTRLLKEIKESWGI